MNVDPNSQRIQSNAQHAADVMVEVVGMGLEPTGAVQLDGRSPVIWVHESIACKELKPGVIIYEKGTETISSPLAGATIKWQKTTHASGTLK